MLPLNLLSKGPDAGIDKNRGRKYPCFCGNKKTGGDAGLRKEIVEYVKEQIDLSLEGWGYHLQDLQINDITFDEVILDDEQSGSK